jgi:ribosomal-protein-alanine N-acetyltransferase
METRLALAADAPALAALHAASFGVAHWSMTQIADSLALATTQAWIVEESEVPQGFVMCQWVGREAEIITFCVTPAAQGKGLGRCLLTAILDSVAAQGAQRVFLEVAVDNIPARALYEKAGFRIIGKRANYYHRDGQRIDALLFALEL